MRVMPLLLAVMLQGNSSLQPRRVQDLVAAVSKNVQEFRDALPDFLCNEKITSTSFVSGKVDQQKVVESLFSIQKNRENREIQFIDGKPAKKNAKMPGLPMNVSGVFGYMIVLTFQNDSVQDHEYTLAQGDGSSLIVQFATRSEQQHIKWTMNGDVRLAKDEGRAWIDPASMQVIRLERHLLNVPRSLTSWTATVEQSPVSIGEKRFWLPKMSRTEVVERDTRKVGVWESEYSNCKQFTADVKIR